MQLEGQSTLTRPIQIINGIIASQPKLSIRRIWSHSLIKTNQELLWIQVCQKSAIGGAQNLLNSIVWALIGIMKIIVLIGIVVGVENRSGRVAIDCIFAFVSLEASGGIPVTTGRTRDTFSCIQLVTLLYRNVMLNIHLTEVETILTHRSEALRATMTLNRIWHDDHVFSLPQVRR
jgi:hypothetical protein